MKRLGVVLAVLATVVVLWTAWAATGRAERAERRVNTLRTELLAIRADSAGWLTRLVAATTDLEAELQTATVRNALLEAEKAELAREVEVLDGQLRLTADLYAEALGEIEALGTNHGPPAQPDSVTATYDDGVLAGRIAFFPPARFGLTYQAQIALVLAAVETPDNRLMLAARASDPRVALSYGETFYQLPDPVRSCSIGQRAQAGVWGYAIGRIAEGGVRALVGR